jgi:ribosomal protein L22
MSKSQLPKFTLSHNDKKERWDLSNDKTNKVVKTFQTKEVATAGGVLKEAIGGEGSVKIKKENGKYQEERTFPRSEDPKKSKG